MRILTTVGNPFLAYAVVRGIREHADFLCVLQKRTYAVGAAASRLVDDAETVPWLTISSWRVTDEGSYDDPAHERYVSAALDVCRRKRIDVFYPTSDLEIFLAAMNRSRFEAIGCYVVAPPFEAVRRVMDKLLIASVAAEHGVAVPRTWRLGADVDAAEVLRECGMPCVVKARFSAGSAAVVVCRTESDALAAIARLRETKGWPIVQEYVPGGVEPSVNTILDKGGRELLGFTLRKLRYAGPSVSTCIQIVKDLPEKASVVNLARSLGIVGFAGIQMKRDARDGRHKLIEINPRLGANSTIHVNLFKRYGASSASLTLAAHGLVEAAPVSFPEGAIGIAPIDDAIAMVKFVQAKLSRNRRPDNPMPRTLDFAKGVLSSYRRCVATDVYWQALRDDLRVPASLYRLTLAETLRKPPALIPWGAARG